MLKVNPSKPDKPGSTTCSRVEWLQRQIAEVLIFIERDESVMSQTPGCFSARLSLESWKQHHKELSDELEDARAG